MTCAVSPDDFDDLHDFIKVQVAAGYAPLDEIVDEAVQVFAGDLGESAALRAAAAAAAAQVLGAHLAGQASWPEQTDCDRLDAAFADLTGDGIVARAHFSCCGTCGAHEIRDEMDQAAKAGLPARGFTFFHVQDTEHAVSGDGLYLSYGAASRDHAAAVAIGHEVVAALSRRGLAPVWNGKLTNRIALPLTWQRRR